MDCSYINQQVGLTWLKIQGNKMIIAEDGRISVKEVCNDDVKILVTGDLCPVANVERELLKGKGEHVFGDCLSELHDKDLSITNLELALTCGGTPIDKCGPNLRANPNIMPELKKAGFDVYSVANNHARDWGDETFMETLSHIERSGARYAGGGDNASSAAEPLKVVVKGVPFAIVSLCMHCDCDAGIDSPGVNALNLPYNTLEIVNAVQDGYKVIVIFHDGKEFIPFPSDRIRNYCRAFVDAGACAVIGHHPHIVRGMEIYKGSLIAYSLGNFIFPQLEGADLPDPFWFQGISVRLSINETGLSWVDVIPHKFNHKLGKLELMEDDEASSFLTIVNRLNRILMTKGENERFFSADCEQYIHYGENLKVFGSNMLNGNWSTEKQQQDAKVFWHFMTCNEHWDLLETVSKRRWHGVTDCPDDLQEIVKLLGRL